MITSHYYKNTNNTPIRCDFEWGKEISQEEKDKQEFEELIKKINSKTRSKLIKIIKEELKKEKSKNQENTENDEYKHPGCINH